MRSVSRVRTLSWVVVALASALLVAAVHARLGARTPPPVARAERAPAPTVAPSAPVDIAAARAAPTVLWVTGDVLLDPSFRRSGAAAGDPAEIYAAMVAPVAKHWREDGDAATVVVNLESPVATLRREPDAYLADAEAIFAETGHRRIPSPLNAPESLLAALSRAGVDVVDVANNHALDQDRAGLGETLDAAHAHGLVTLGGGRGDDDARRALMLGERGARIALLATFVRDHGEPSRLGPSEPRLDVVDARTLDEVRRAAAESDAVVVVVHVVAELLSRPTPSTRLLAAALVAAGADAVIVHGPHVIAPVERVESGGRSGVVAYSLGNFVSDMGKDARPGRISPERSRASEPDLDKWHDPRTRSGLAARISLTPGEPLDVAFLPTWMHSDRFLLDQGLARPPITFTVEPLAACGPPLALRTTWPREASLEMQTWVAWHRDTALDTARLSSAECARCASEAPCRWLGEALLLRPR